MEHSNSRNSSEFIGNESNSSNRRSRSRVRPSSGERSISAESVLRKLRETEGIESVFVLIAM